MLMTFSLDLACPRCVVPSLFKLSSVLVDLVLVLVVIFSP